MTLFAANPLTTCLYTTVRNMDSVAHFYGFLPPHGRRLDVCEEMSFWGDLWDRFHRLTPQERFRRSFEGTLTGDGNLVIVESPSEHIYDAVLDQTQIINLVNGAFVAVDPCWGAYSSSLVCE